MLERRKTLDALEQVVKEVWQNRFSERFDVGENL
jgi:hypothetical protein